MKLMNFIYGDRYVNNGDDCRAECPTCGKDALEISNVAPHQWQCWHCKASGNAYTLIQAYYDSLPELNKGTANPMLKLKPGTTFASWKKMGLRVSDRGYVAPCHNTEGKIVCLYRFSESNNTWYSTPKPTSLQVMGLHNLVDDLPIMIAEGHADYNVMLEHVNPEEFCLLGLCGSSFPTKLLQHLEGRTVIFLGDNDEAGRNGATNLVSRMKKNGTLALSVSYVDWSLIPYDIPEKGDMRDLSLAIGETL